MRLGRVQLGIWRAQRGRHNAKSDEPFTLIKILTDLVLRIHHPCDPGNVLLFQEYHREKQAQTLYKLPQVQFT